MTGKLQDFQFVITDYGQASLYKGGVERVRDFHRGGFSQG